MPVLFVGHGSPMNAVEENEFTAGWRSMVKDLPRPEMILCISAHWETHGIAVTSSARPEMIYDFYGFPEILYEVTYPAPGSPGFAEQVRDMLRGNHIEIDPVRGLDHGCWSVLVKMFPAADIPVVQLSLNRDKPAVWHVGIAKELAGLRKKNVLIIGSGNIVHNLRLLDWDMKQDGYEWARDINSKLKALIEDRNITALQNYDAFGMNGRLAIPTPEHYLPMLYCLALGEPDEALSFFNDAVVMGSLSMTSFLLR